VFVSPFVLRRDLQSHSPAEVLYDSVVVTLISMSAPVYAGLDRRLGRLPNFLQEMREYVRRRALLETAYARTPHGTKGNEQSAHELLKTEDPAVFILYTSIILPSLTPWQEFVPEATGSGHIGSICPSRKNLVLKTSLVELWSLVCKGREYHCRETRELVG
jgi:hypothetical protein